MADGSLDTTDVAQVPSVISPDENPSFSELANNITDGNFSDQGAPYDIQRACGYYVVDHAAEAPLENLGDTQAQLEAALGSQYADVIAADLKAIAANQLQFDPEVITATNSSAGDPVSLGTGQFIHSVTDFTVPGAGIDFAFVRTYKSSSYYRGPLGFNWDHSANQWIYLNSDLSLSLQTGQLRPTSYNLNSAARREYFVATGEDSVIVKTIAGLLERHWPDGRVDQFQNLTGDATVYQIISTTDRFGNSISYTYTQHDAQYLLTSLSVNNAQRVVQFLYDDMARVITVTLFDATYWTPFGPTVISRRWSYKYDDFGDLVSVTGPATDSFPVGCTTQYAYSSSSSFALRPHDLTVITDPNGDAYLENEYGGALGRASFGRVVRQRLGDGVVLFDWQQVIPNPAWTFSSVDRPDSAVTVIQRNGHEISYVLNAAGNVLLSRETVLAGRGTETLVWRFAYDGDGRQIATLSPEGCVTQTYYGRQHYYDTNYPGESGPDVPLPWVDPHLKVADHVTFSNVLATVKRGGFFDLTRLADDVAFFGSIFPAATSPNALGGTDIIVKYAYESTFQQRATSSDPRYTASADPAFPEAPAYFAHLTTVTFNPTPGATPAAITYPSTSYPDGTAGVASAHLTYDLYDARGRLQQYTDPEGDVFAQSYFPASAARPTLEGFVASRTVGLGTLNLVTAFEVNETGLAIAQIDPAGNRSEFDFDARNLLRVVTLPLAGYSVAMTYDGNGQAISTLATIVQADGSLNPGSPEVRYVTYNSQMSPVLTSFGDSSGVALRQIRQVYDASNRLTRTLLPRGNSICYEYDERLLLKRTTRGCCSPGAASTSYGYNGDGQRITTTDPLGHTTTLTLDSFARAIGIVDPVGTLQRIDYDQLGNVIVRRWFGATAPASYSLARRTEFLFDERGQLVRTRQSMFSAPIPTADPWNAPDSEYNTAVAAGTVELYDSLIFRDGNLRPFLLIDANGNATTIAYDSANRRTTVTDPVGSFDGVIYDANGNITRLDHCCADATGTLRAVISTGYEYDPLNRLVATTDGAGNRTLRALDSRGLLITQTDPLGHINQWSYSPFRERVSETQILLGAGGSPPTSLTTVFTYDSNSNLLSVTDPRGNTTTTAYDLLDRPGRTTNPDQSFRTTSYDPNGNPVARVDEDGVTVQQAFDAANRLTAINVQYPVAAPSSAEQGVTMAYNGVGDLIAHQNDFVSVTRTCDSLGRCFSESFDFAAPLNTVPSPLTIRRTFDSVSNLIQLEYPSGQELQYSYDPANRLTAIESIANSTPYPGDSSAAARRAILQKQWWGDLQVSATLGNGVNLSRDFDAAARRIADGCTLPNGNSTELQLLWDGAGNRALSIDANDGHIVGSLYSYDSTDRLATVAQIRAPGLFAPAGIEPPTARPIIWTPDAQGTIDALVGGYSAIQPPQLQYSYDSVGNRTTQRSGSSTITYTSNSRNEYVNVDSTPLTYNLAGRLVADARFAYQYNFRGQLTQATASGRIAAQVFHDALGRPIASIEDRRTRVLVPDGMNAIEFYDSGSLSTLNITEGRDRLCFFASGGRDQYVMRDVLESTRLTTDTRGVATGYFEYDPFGALVGGTPATQIRYAGKYHYAPVDWYEFMLRQYLPALGRFAQPDPAGFVDGANLFAFLANNPLSGRDPNGTDRQAVETDWAAYPEPPGATTPPDDNIALSRPPLLQAPDTLDWQPRDAGEPRVYAPFYDPGAEEASQWTQAQKEAVQKAWTPEDEKLVRSIVDDALARKEGDVALAFAFLRDRRELEENFYDTNLAIAADYLRARWETLKWGPSIAWAKVETYMELKKRGQIGPQGPGPVSPFSELERAWMEQGVKDQSNAPDDRVGVYWNRLGDYVRFIGERMHD